MFSHVYVEQDAYAFPLTKRVLERLRHAVVVPIQRYGDIFNRPGQDIRIQKHGPKLLLAVQRGPFLRPGAEVCDHFGQTRFLYATQMMNCPYDCAYCYLKGLYASAHMVAFVNTADYFTAVDAVLPAYVSISYDADLLALESLFGYAGLWTAYAAARPSLILEIRTKSADARLLAGLTPADNTVLAWTISPEADAIRYERNAPPPAKRIAAMQAAVAGGWQVRLCVDPVLMTAGWETRLDELADTIKTQVDVKRLCGISVGGFRVAKAHYKKIRRLQPGAIPTGLPLVEQDGIIAYPPEAEEAIKQRLLRRLCL